MLTQKRLKELLEYNPETGIFIRKTAIAQVKAGSIVGYSQSGYLAARLDASPYYLHRLAWIYVHGYFPKDQIDHINCIRKDNRIVNLREATDAENRQNMPNLRKDNVTGFTGVSPHKATGKFRARVKINGKEIHLGLFETKEQAYEIHIKEKRKHYPFCTI